MPIGLIALDERPVNTRYPEMIGAIAGIEVLQPPVELRSAYKTPANCDAITDWLRQHAAQMDALIVSIETLGYGGLVLSRITHDPASTIIDRLEVLREVKQAYPHLRIYGFDLITRISRSNSDFEEPPYWTEYGNMIYRYSQLFDRAKQGQEVDAASLRHAVPGEHMHDFVKRRLRNHAVNLTVIEMLADDIFDTLVISSDDTSEYGFGTREKRWLNEWLEKLGGDDRLLMYPGADEVGCALLARAITDQAPSFAVHYGIAADRDRIAPFEDGPVSLTVERQIRAIGGQIVDGDAEFIVAVNPPSPADKPFFDYTDMDTERAYREAPLWEFVNQIDAWINAGRHVIVADVAYPNGSDPVLVDLLRETIDLTRLAAYGGWNTAGNTTGTALAQGIAAARSQDEAARLRFLLHRYIEDWGYQHGVRHQLQEWLNVRYNTPLINDENIRAAKDFIESRLNKRIAELPGFAGSWRVQPGSIRLPWQRTFEVDFDLEQISQR
jgi:hypothetical protein